MRIRKNAGPSEAREALGLPQSSCVTMMVGVIALITGCGAPSGEVGPASAYDHSGFSEVSVATEDVIAGQASTIAEGLEQGGFWCVQPRGNDVAVQIACQSPERDIRVDVLAAPDGDVLFARIDLGAPTVSVPPEDVRDRLSQVLEASFLRLWPQDRRAIEDLVGQAQPDPFMPMGQEAPPVDPAEQYSTNDRRTGSGSWSLRSRYTGEPLALRVRTPRSVQEGWPFDGRHYATSVEVAMARFAEAGFTCGTSCSRASDGQTIDFDDHDGQIVVARFTLRSSIDGDRSADPASRWVRDGLPFLTPAVRAAVSRRVEECRINRCSWSGVVAGTPVDAVTVPGASTTRDGRPAADLMVTIGIGLLRSA